MVSLMESVIYKGPKEVMLEKSAYPAAKEGWSIVKVKTVGICGSDLYIFSGGHPRAQAPLIMGHEFAGEIVEDPQLAPGTRVTVNPLLSCGECETCQKGLAYICENLRLVGIDRNGAMAEYVSVPSENILQLPDTVSYERGALVEPIAVCVHAIKESKFREGDQVNVFGAGPIGLLTAITLRKMGAGDVRVIEVQEFRRRKAEELGFTVINPSLDEKAIPVADITFDCAGHSSVASLLTNVTKVKGQIVVVATYKKPTEIDLQAVNFKELSLIGTRVYTHENVAEAIRMVQEDESYEKVITHRLPLSETKEAFDLLVDQRDALKIIIQL